MLNGPTSRHEEELRRLALFVVRQFTEAAAKNPKIYAELLFWKTVRECNDLENGYESHNDGTKRGWSEEQEEELRQLFEENQTNPQTDQGELLEAPHLYFSKYCPERINKSQPKHINHCDCIRIWLGVEKWLVGNWVVDERVKNMLVHSFNLK